MPTKSSTERVKQIQEKLPPGPLGVYSNALLTELSRLCWIGDP